MRSSGLQNGTAAARNGHASLVRSETSVPVWHYSRHWGRKAVFTPRLLSLVAVAPPCSRLLWGYKELQKGSRQWKFPVLQQ